jgi:hypothetical protein
VDNNGIVSHNFKDYNEGIGFFKSSKIANYKPFWDNVNRHDATFSAIPTS